MAWSHSGRDESFYRDFIIVQTHSDVIRASQRPVTLLDLKAVPPHRWSQIETFKGTTEQKSTSFYFQYPGFLSSMASTTWLTSYRALLSLNWEQTSDNPASRIFTVAANPQSTIESFQHLAGREAFSLCRTCVANAFYVSLLRGDKPYVLMIW